MSRTPIPDYAQFLLKTLLKTTGRSRESGTNPNILAVCTIVVRPRHAQHAFADGNRTLYLRESYADVGISINCCPHAPEPR